MFHTHIAELPLLSRSKTLVVEAGGLLSPITYPCMYFSVSSDQVWAAHLCYLLAGENFGFPTEEKTKMALIGINHR